MGDRKLISMVEFTINNSENALTSKTIEEHQVDVTRRFFQNFKYADFLSQNPNLGMFVPAIQKEDGSWEVLEEPASYADQCLGNVDSPITATLQYGKQYQEALSNVIFEGLHILSECKYYWDFSRTPDNCDVLRVFKTGTLEESVDRIILTESKAKELNL